MCFVQEHCFRRPALVRASHSVPVPQWQCQRHTGVRCNCQLQVWWSRVERDLSPDEKRTSLAVSSQATASSTV